MNVSDENLRNYSYFVLFWFFLFIFCKLDSNWRTRINHTWTFL